MVFSFSSVVILQTKLEDEAAGGHVQRQELRGVGLGHVLDAVLLDEGRDPGSPRPSPDRAV